LSQEEIEAFPNWLWGRMHPQDFQSVWGPLRYELLGILCGVSKSTVQHWFSDPRSPSHREPGDRYQRMLILIDWLLSTFSLTPEELLAQFELYRQQQAPE
jgi:hypothetical protein